MASCSLVAPGKGLLLQEAGRAVLCACQHVFNWECVRKVRRAQQRVTFYMCSSFPKALSYWILPGPSKETNFEGVFWPNSL